jgi:hypothetical protein
VPGYSNRQERKGKLVEEKLVRMEGTGRKARTESDKKEGREGSGN